MSITARTGPPIPVRGYASRAGRIDVIARAMTEIREGAGLVALLEGPPDPPKALVYVPTGDCRISSERHAVLEIARALLGKSNCISVEKADFQTIVMVARKTFDRLVLLHESGDINLRVHPQSAYFLGSHIDMPDTYVKLLDRVAHRISVGPASYHTEHVIAYLEWARLACNEPG